MQCPCGGSPFRGGGGLPRPWPKTFLFVRHGESAYNAHYAVNGTDTNDLWDANLTVLGEQQAKALEEQLASRRPKVQLAVVSPLTRAIRTGLLAMPQHRHPSARWEVTSLAAEHLEASCDVGRTPRELSRDFPELSFTGMPEVWWYVPDDLREGITPERSRQLFSDSGRREPAQDFLARVDKFASFLSSAEETVVAVFAHADFLHALLSRFFSSLDPKFADYWMHNCELVEVSAPDPRWLQTPRLPVSEKKGKGETVAEPEAEEEKPVQAPRRTSSAALALSALQQEIAAGSPELSNGEVRRAASMRWKVLDTDSRAQLISQFGVD